MSHTKNQPYFLLVCLAAVLIVSYFIVQPLLGPLIVAAVFAFLFQPLYRRFLRMFNHSESLASLVTTVFAIVLVIVPITFLITQILKETSQFYVTLVNGDKGSFTLLIQDFLLQVRTFLPIPDGFQLDLNKYLLQGLDLFLENITIIFSSLTKIFLHFFVFLTAFYFLLKDGHKLKDYFVDLSPLENSDDEFIVNRLKLAVSSVVKGNLFVGLIQGSLTGIGFMFFGVPNAVLWGSVAAIAALIPGIGTALIIFPAIIFLFITGKIVAGFGLLVWGLVAVGLIDNFVGPKLVGRGMQLHPLAVFVSVLGGLALFGPLGFLLGPVVISLCIALVEVYFSLKARIQD